MSREIYRVHGRCELYAGEDTFEVCLPACCPEALLYGVTRYVLNGVRVRHFLKEHHTEGVGQYQHRRPASRDARAAALRPRRLRRVLLAGTVVVPVERLLRTTDEASMNTRVEFTALPIGAGESV